VYVAARETRVSIVASRVMSSRGNWCEEWFDPAMVDVVPDRVGDLASPVPITKGPVLPSLPSREGDYQNTAHLV
jgi:hypothetical protein